MLSRPATDGLCGVQAEDSVVVTGIGGVARSGENGSTEPGKEIAIGQVEDFCWTGCCLSRGLVLGFAHRTVGMDVNWEPLGHDHDTDTYDCEKDGARQDEVRRSENRYLEGRSEIAQRGGFGGSGERIEKGGATGVGRGFKRGAHTQPARHPRFCEPGQ